MMVFLILTPLIFSFFGTLDACLPETALVPETRKPPPPPPCKKNHLCIQHGPSSKWCELRFANRNDPDTQKYTDCSSDCEPHIGWCDYCSENSRHYPHLTFKCRDQSDYEGPDLRDDAEITKENLHTLFDDTLFKIAGFTEEGFQEQWAAMAGDSGVVNKAQLANYLKKYIHDNNVNLGQDYFNIDEAGITQENLHTLVEDQLQLFKIAGFTEEGFQEQWAAMAGDSGVVNETQLANYIMKLIHRNNVNLRQDANYEEDKDANSEEDKDANSEKKKSINLNFHFKN